MACMGLGFLREGHMSPWPGVPPGSSCGEGGGGQEQPGYEDLDLKNTKSGRSVIPAKQKRCRVY